MKASRWLACSLVLNAVLLGFLAHWATRHPQRSDLLGEITNRTIRVISQRNPVESKPASSIEIIQPFHWSAIESEDYRVYATNLRALGCPEATVRDILIADVNELYDHRVDELVAPVQARYWELMANRAQFLKVVEEKESELETLTVQRKALLDELLGSAARRSLSEELANSEDLEAARQLLDFLPSTTAAQYLEVDQKYATIRQQLAATQPPLAPNELQARLKQLQEKQDGEIAQILSPEELAEYRLRKSGAANLRFTLQGFQATEDELKQLARLRQESPGTDTGAQQRQRDQIRELLGPERAIQFEHAQDSRFVEFYQVAERFDVPSQAVADAFEARKIAEEKAGDVRGDNSLSREDRLAALKAIRQETDQFLQKALGGQAFATYRSRSGEWLDQLERAP